MTVLDLFAGPGGWDVAAQQLGIDPLGIEWDDAACATRKAAGLQTIQGDVAALDPDDFPGITGLIASPPCQAWSMAGKRGGERDKQYVYTCADHLARGKDYRSDLREACEDPRSLLVVEPIRWVHALRPEWVALEQVPPVLELWQHFAWIFRTWGYSVWTGIVNAADYGVPQTRQRAILLARADGAVSPPEPTHCRGGAPESMFGPGLLPWVSMAEALGWGVQRPSQVVTAGGGKSGGAEPFANADFRRELRQTVRTGNNSTIVGNPYERSTDEPAPTVDTGAGRKWTLHTNRDQQPDGTRQTVECDQPAPSFTAKSGGQWQLRMNSQANATVRSLDEPAGTIFTGHHMNEIRWAREPASTIVTTRRSSEGIIVGRQLPEGEGAATGGHGWDGERTSSKGGDAVKITVHEAAILQSFPPDYPWQGSRTKQFEQIGNAIPPRLALHLLSAVTGQPIEVAA